MGRLIFDSSGGLKGVDGKIGDVDAKLDFTEGSRKSSGNLKRSDSLEFLQDKRFENVFEKTYWSFHSDGKKIPPLKFSNGKTQEGVVEEVAKLIGEGHKVIFLHGVCGSGKSAIALNLARVLGSGSIVVPVKALQKQYEDDYMGKNYLIKQSGEKMKIAMITGKVNHDSIIEPGVSCADPMLPENIKITERNYSKLLEYYKDNPFASKDDPDLKDLRRISIAPSNPYWSPILPANFEVGYLRDSRKMRYHGADGKEYIFYHRKSGCSYYDQYLAYKKADVIIYNSAKYLAEMAIGRKPMTEIEIIDEADEFLDSLFQQEELNLSRLASALKMIYPESSAATEVLDDILELIELEEKNKRILGVDESKVFHIDETKLGKILGLFVSNSELESEIAIDEVNYSNKALEVAGNFKGSLKEVYLTYRKDDEGNLYTKLVSTNLSAKFNDLLSKSKALIFMSGTLHSDSVLKNIFGIKDYHIVEAETLNLGSMEIVRTGKEFDCKYSNFSSKKHTREDYLSSLSACMDKAKTPVLIHVNAFQDLPSEDEKRNLEIQNVMSVEKLKHIQNDDKIGRNVALFKQGLADSLFTTRCSRGVDFPGETCNSIIFTKYPNPNVSDTFWKILQKTHPEYFWDFYKDKARREFLQRISRALRFKDDHVYILSPDSRVLDAVRRLQDGK